MAQSEITQIGKYRIVGQVGEGAMGVVYRATDPVLNRTVAVKVMCDAVARDDDLRGRFLREAQAAGSLQHPNVITIYDFGEVDGHLYIAMEFVEGEDLEALLTKRIPLSLVDKLDIAIDVLSGLAFAHKRGIVHRDIKPANIRIDEEGRARIMDFGIAHLSSSNMTRTGMMVGTPAYMAPEQIVGSGIVPATDLFSTGAVLYELLSGTKPFQGESIQGVMYKIVSQPHVPLDTVKLGIPSALNAIIGRALAKDPSDRYADAVEMANALTAVRAGLDRTAIASESVSLRSVIDMGLTAEREAKRRAKRRSALTHASAGAGIILLPLLGFVLTRGKSPSTQLAGAPSSAAVPERDSAASRVSGSPAAPVNPTTAAVAVDSIPSAPGGASSRALPQAVPKTTKPDLKGTASPEVLLVKALQTTALGTRQRAIEAGASPEQLRPGDEHNRAADGLIARGKLSDAAAKLNEATAAWAVAERDARILAAAASARTRLAVADSPRRDAPIPASPPVVNPPQAATAKLPLASPTAEIEFAVAAYARAIESRDIAEVRKAYPGITAAQAGGFEQFFASVRSLRANFSVSSIDVNGSSADGKLTGTYDYLTSSGKSERQSVSFQATFRRDANGWKLASVR